MAFSLNAGDVVEVRLNMRQNGQNLMNVMHYRIESGSTIDGKGTLEALLAQMDSGPTSLIGGYLDFCTTALQFVSLNAQKIYTTRYLTISRAVGGFGLKAGTALPQNIQASFTKRVEQVAESVTGRMELPGLVTSDVEDGIVVSDTVEQITTIAADWCKIYEIGDPVVSFVPIVLRRSNIPNSQIVAAFRAQDTVRVARRRTVGVGG